MDILTIYVQCQTGSLGFNFNHHTGAGVSAPNSPGVFIKKAARKHPFKTRWVAYLKGPARVPTGHRAIILADFRKYMYIQ